MGWNKSSAMKSAWLLSVLLSTLCGVRRGGRRPWRRRRSSSRDSLAKLAWEEEVLEDWLCFFFL
jgi:hypothetical protein